MSRYNFHRLLHTAVNSRDDPRVVLANKLILIAVCVRLGAGCRTHTVRVEPMLAAAHISQIRR
jgi:hypothetical protein